MINKNSENLIIIEENGGTHFDIVENILTFLVSVLVGISMMLVMQSQPYQSWINKIIPTDPLSGWIQKQIDNNTQDFNLDIRPGESK